MTAQGRDQAYMPDGLTGAEWVGVGLSLLWIGGIGWRVSGGAPDSGTGDWYGAVLAASAAVIPPLVIWAGLMVLRAIRVIRHEAACLEDAIDAVRAGYEDNPHAPQTPDDGVVLKLEEIATAQRGIEAKMSELRDAPEAPEPVPQTAATPSYSAQTGPSGPDDQVTLPLGIPAEEASPDLGREDFITALNFPENPDDTAGFGSLRRALRDRSAAQVIRAAQDILTLMSQDGIYMDDLTPDLAHPDVWRRFAEGERGRGVAAVGGVRDRAALDVTARRMKQDAIFRDVAHHFLRLFDRMFAGFAPTASDTEISALAQTRTARAFMLLTRVAGTFD